MSWLMDNIDQNKPSQLAESGEACGEQSDIRSGLVRIIYSSVPLTLIAVLANSVVLSIVQWGVIAHTTILTWFGVTNGLSLVRLGLYLKFRKLGEEGEVPVFWVHLALLILSLIHISEPTRRH